MSTCKDCMHDVICPYSLAEVACDDFKDRSKFIELPCKVGDMVYQIVYCYDRRTCPATIYPSSYLEKEVVGVHICDSRLRVNALSNKKYRDYLIVKVGGNAIQHIPFAKIGKTVFLTKKEAEQALTERVKDNG